MLKRIALVGIFAFVSAISTAAVTNAAQETSRSTISAPTAPQPKGVCPFGMRC